MLRFRQRVLSGLLVLVPLGITWFVLSIFLSATVGFAASILEIFLDNIPLPALYVLATAVLLVSLYFTGLLASNVLGKRLIGLAEKLVHQVPLVATVYGTSKQVIELFQSRPESQTQAVALIGFPGPGMRAFGFVMGELLDTSGTECYMVFVPTTPNPTTGFLQIVEKTKAEILDMNSETAFRTIISAGLLAPKKLEVRNVLPSEAENVQPGLSAVD